MRKLIICLAITMAITAAVKAEIIKSGECGESVTWELDDKGLLSISGNGEIMNYNLTDSIAPWDQNDSVRKIIIGDKISKIGNCAFPNLPLLREMVIGKSVKEMGLYAIYNCQALQYIKIKAETPPHMEKPAFFQMSFMEDVEVPCGTIENYRNTNFWHWFKCYREGYFDLSVSENDILKGRAGIIKKPTCDNNLAEIVAIPEQGFEFLYWEDGINDNPRYIFVEEDMKFKAIFAAIKGDILEDGFGQYIKVYAENGLITTENNGNEYRIYSVSGQMVYKGSDPSIKLNKGIYIVRCNGQSIKIVL